MNELEKELSEFAENLELEEELQKLGVPYTASRELKDAIWETRDIGGFNRVMAILARYPVFKNFLYMGTLNICGAYPYTLLYDIHFIKEFKDDGTVTLYLIKDFGEDKYEILDQLDCLSDCWLYKENYNKEE